MAGIKVRKTFGQIPEKVVVLATVVEFDSEGNAEVSEDVAKTLANIPGYEVVEAEAKKPAPKKGKAKAEKPAEPEAVTEEAEASEEEAPKKPTPKKPSPRKPKN